MIAFAVSAGLMLQQAAAPPVRPAEDDIVVTGSRLPEVSAPARIEADEIERLQPAALTDVLDRLPGVHAVATSGIGGSSFVSVRGGEPNFTLVLIDGVRVNDPSNAEGGAFDFAQLDPGLVESITLVPASASAVHGSDALGGVISLRLRAPEGQGWSASGRVQADSRGAYGASASLGLGWQGGGAMVSGGGFDSGDLSAGSELRREQILGRVTQRLGAFDLSAFALHAASERNGFPEDSGGPLFAQSPERERRSTHFTVAGFGLAGTGDRPLQPQLNLGWYSQLTDSDTPAIPPGALQGVPAIDGRTLFQRFQATGSLRFAAGDRLGLVAGADYLWEEGRSRSTIDFGFPLPADFMLRRSSAALFAEGRWRPVPALTLAGAVRHDWYRSAGETTPRVSMSLAPGGGLPILEASYSEGYKLPSLYALGSPLIGNPALRPERSRGVEVGLRQAIPGGEARLTWFRTQYRDLVDFDVDRFILVNRLGVVVEGAEFALLAHPAPGLELAGNVTYAATRSEVPLRSRPKWQGSGRITWHPAPAWAVELTGRANGPLLEASVPTGTVTLSGHVELGAAVRWAWSPHLDVTATLEDLLDARWQDAVGFPSPGRLVRVSIAGRF